MKYCDRYLSGVARTWRCAARRSFTTLIRSRSHEIHFTVDREISHRDRNARRHSGERRRAPRTIASTASPRRSSRAKAARCASRWKAARADSRTPSAISNWSQNGTFFNNSVAPSIGYRSERELDDANDRRKYGLKEIDLMPALERHCTADCIGKLHRRPRRLGGCGHRHQHVSRSNRRRARFAGARVAAAKAGGITSNTSSTIPRWASIRSFPRTYQVAREDWNGIKLEVYYLKDHPWNVPRMMNSMRKSLDYYIAQLRALRPQRSAHHRVSAGGQIRASLSRHHALFGSHRVHRQPEPSRRYRLGLLRGGA